MLHLFTTRQLKANAPGSPPFSTFTMISSPRQLPGGGRRPGHGMEERGPTQRQWHASGAPMAQRQKPIAPAPKVLRALLRRGAGPEPSPAKEAPEARVQETEADR